MLQRRPPENQAVERCSFYDREIQLKVKSPVVTFYEIVRLARLRTAAAGNGETKRGLSLVIAANMRMTDGLRRAA